MKAVEIGEVMEKKSGKGILKLAGNHLNLTVDEAAGMTLKELVKVIKKLSASVVAQAEKKKKEKK